jgi:hypothetical protein
MSTSKIVGPGHRTYLERGTGLRWLRVSEHPANVRWALV